MEFEDIINDIEKLNESIEKSEQAMADIENEINDLIEQKSDLEKQEANARIYGLDTKDIKENISKKEEEIKQAIQAAKDRKKELDVLKKDIKNNMIELRNDSKDIEVKKEIFEQYQNLLNDNPDLQDIVKQMSEKQKEIKSLEEKIESMGQTENALIQQYRNPLENRQIELKSAKSRFVKIAQDKLDALPKNKRKEVMNFIQEQVEQIGQEGNIVVNEDKIDMHFVQDNIDKLEEEISERESIVTEYEKENNIDLSLEEKTKWYEFVKKFKQWRESKETKALPEAKEVNERNEYKEEQPIMKNIEKEEKTNSFLEGLKIVKESKRKITGYVKDINMYFRSKVKIQFTTRESNKDQNPYSRPVYNPTDIEMDER